MNLFCWIPVENDATSFYRALQPLSQLRKIISNLNLFHAPHEINLKHVTHMDAVFLQRPSLPAHIELMKLCKNLNIPVWVDYDDNLLKVPASNPYHSMLNAPQQLKNIRNILNMADVISVSTTRLAIELTEELNTNPHKSIYIIPNAFNDYLFKDKPIFKPHNVVMWRGTASHQEDLLGFSQHILKVARNNPNWLFNFVGYNPFFISSEIGKQGVCTDPMEIMVYHDFMRQAYPNIVMVTLSDTVFNRCKSNIAWIEGTYAGAAAIGPSWDEWEKPGITNYKTMDNFEWSLQSCMRDSEETENKHRISWEYIQDSLRLSVINEQRKILLGELLG